MLKLFDPLNPDEIRAQIDGKRRDLEQIRADITDARENARDAMHDSDRTFADYWRKRESKLKEQAAALEADINKLAERLADKETKKGH